MRRRVGKAFVAVLSVVVLSLFCSSIAAVAQTTVTLWGMSALSPGQQRMVDEFNRRHDDIELVLETKVTNFSGQTISSIAKLLISIAAGVPPAVTTVDRFIVGGLAARGALLPLDAYMERDGVSEDLWYDAVIDEAKYNGKIYALPSGTDNRALYYNQDHLVKAGYDPERPPRTWDELLEYARDLTHVNNDGLLEQIGFAPLYNQGWFYLWGWQNGGSFLSDDGRVVTLDDPYLVEALEFLVELYDEIGGYTVVHDSLGDAPFRNERLSMQIAGNWTLNDMARNEREFNWSVAPPPVPAARFAQEGRFLGKPQFITWSGGWSWAIPVGVENPEAAWEVVKFLTSFEAHKINAEATFEYHQANGWPYIPGMTGNREADRYLTAEYLPNLPARFFTSQQLFIELLDVTRFRPVTPLAPELWEAQAEAPLQAMRHEATPRDALQNWDRRVQAKLDEYYATGTISE